MTPISEIFSTFGPEYMERFGNDVPLEHRKAVDAMIACRTRKAGITYYECEQCGHLHVIYRSCGNRHCPTCQHLKNRQWLETQMKRRFPGVVF
jgi:rubrerythrin